MYCELIFCPNSAELVENHRPLELEEVIPQVHPNLYFTDEEAGYQIMNHICLNRLDSGPVKWLGW